MSYLLPLVHQLREPRNKKGFRAVIVAPTRELASQIFRECEKLCEPRQGPLITDGWNSNSSKWIYHCVGLSKSFIMIKSLKISRNFYKWIIY